MTISSSWYDVTLVKRPHGIAGEKQTTAYTLRPVPVLLGCEFSDWWTTMACVIMSSTPPPTNTHPFFVFYKCLWGLLQLPPPELLESLVELKTLIVQ